MPVDPEYINLENPPVSTNEHLSADYIELLCLTSMDGVISKEQAAARIFKLIDIDTDFEELEKEAELEEEGLLHLDDEADYLPKPKYKISEKKSRQANDWFDQLEFRVAVYGDAYPFFLSEDKGILYKKSEISLKSKLYIYLLLASSLRYFSKSVQTQLANYFEIVSAIALKRYLSPASEVHLFGNNPLNTGRYTGPFWDRIVGFCTDIRDKPKRERSYYPSNSPGERGVDVVGWLPLVDTRESLVVIMGQCACGYDDWETKQLSSHSTKWRTYIDFTVTPINTIFIPHNFRSANGEWYDITQIHDSILFDRLRLIHLLTDVCDILDRELPYDIVDKVINIKESLV